MFGRRLIGCALAALAGFAPCERSPGQESRGVAVFQAGSGLCGVELTGSVGPAGRRDRLEGFTLRGPPLRMTLSEGLSASSPWPQQLSLMRRSGGRWIVGESFDRGGARALRYWSGRDDVAAAYRIRRVRIVSSDTPLAERADSPSLAWFKDLWDAQFAESRGRLHLIANGLGATRHGGGLDGSAVWTAVLPEAAGAFLEAGPFRRTAPALDGIVIAGGVDPRVIRMGDRHVLAVRDTPGFLEASAPLRFYESVDLESWKPAFELWDGIAAEKTYGVAVYRGAIWVATTKSAKQTREMRLWRHAPEGGRWEDAGGLDLGPNPAHDAPQPRVWVFGDPEKPRPVVVYGATARDLRIVE